MPATVTGLAPVSVFSDRPAVGQAIHAAPLHARVPIPPKPAHAPEASDGFKMKITPPPVASIPKLAAVRQSAVVQHPPQPKVPGPIRPKTPPAAKAVLAGLVVTVLFAGYWFFLRGPAVPRQDAVAAPVTAPITASAAKLVGTVAAAPAKLIDKGQSAIAEFRKEQQERVDATAVGEEAHPTPVAALAPVVAAAAIAKDVSTGAAVYATANASPAFRAFVANASIGAVFQGRSSKALINGTIVREGQVVEHSLGVCFDHVDADTKVIYFKDLSGAVVSKYY
jgi:hypothetical protein